MRTIVLIVALSLTGACFAQEKAGAPSPELRAFSDRLTREIQTGLQCQTYNYTLEDRVKAAEAEVKRLTDKYEPKEPKLLDPTVDK